MSFIRSSSSSGSRFGAHYLSSLSSAKLASLSECAQDKAILLQTVLIQNALRVNTYEAYVEHSTSYVEYSSNAYSPSSSLGMLAEEDEETEVEVEEVTFDDDAFDFAPTLVSPVSIPKTTASVEPAIAPTFSFLESHFASQTQREHQWFEQCMADIEADHDDFFTASPSPPSSHLDRYSSELVPAGRKPVRSNSIDSIPSLHDEDCESCAGSDSDSDDGLSPSPSVSDIAPLIEIKAPWEEGVYFERREDLFKEQWRIRGKVEMGGLAMSRPRGVGFS